MIKVIVNGALGQMGKEACVAIEKSADFKLVAGLGRGDDLAGNIVKKHADIVVDLTTAESAFDNARTIIESGAHPVIGTSGLLEADIDKLKAICAEKNLGGLIVPNFSIGVVLLAKFSQMAARFFAEVEIIEGHHPQKKDAPSGTALQTAHLIAKNRTRDPLRSASKEILSGARGACCNDVPIHSVRLPGILARQDVLFGAQGELLTLSHSMTERNAFMPGVLFACKKVLLLDKLYYGLDTVIDFEQDIV